MYYPFVLGGICFATVGAGELVLHVEYSLLDLHAEKWIGCFDMLGGILFFIGGVSMYTPVFTFYNADCADPAHQGGVDNLVLSL